MAVISSQSAFAELYARVTEDEQVLLDERAAIYEYDAGHSREQAEALAAAEFAAPRMAHWEWQAVMTGGQVL